jgi:glycosyltransferase involved in cell wall biosynthesis
LVVFAGAGAGPVSTRSDTVILCEIRVPTYRRPKLLERALRSVQAQTHTNWRCIVFDDCPNRSAKLLVERLADQRITYAPNSPRLGAAGNIDQCFRNRPLLGGEYACILEDDNYFFPDFLRHSLDACLSSGVDLTFSAQLCESVDSPGEPGHLNGKTLAWIYPEGILTPAQMFPAIMFSHGFSNGAVFWRLGAQTDFELRGVTQSPGVQESARLMRLAGTVHVSHQADGTWRINSPTESLVNVAAPSGFLSRKKERWRQLLEHRQFVALRRDYLRRVGLGATLAVAKAADEDRRRSIEDACLTCGAYVVLTDRTFAWRIKRLARGWLFRTLVPNAFYAKALNPIHPA